jgi:hypothetical protein
MPAPLFLSRLERLVSEVGSSGELKIAEIAEDRGERGGELHKESGYQPQGAEKK